MKRFTKIAITIGAAVSLGLAAPAISAHPSGYGPGWHIGDYGGGPGYGMGPGWGMHGDGWGPGYGMGRSWGMHGYAGAPGYGMGPQAMFGGFGAGLDDNLAGMKARLGITSEQEDAWQAFVKTAKNQHDSREVWFDKMHQARRAGSAPEFLARQTEFMKQREAETQASATALNDLYAALTPEQKERADQSFGGYGPGYCLQAFAAADDRTR